MGLQGKEEEKDKKHVGKLFRKKQIKIVSINSRLKDAIKAYHERFFASDMLF